ncbi:Ribosomal protein L18ae/LX family protein, partial [Prunus dulcis]
CGLDGPNDEPKTGKQKSKVQQNEKLPKLPGCQSRQLSQPSTKLKPLPNNLGLAGDQQSQQYYGTFQGVANYYPTVPPPPPEPVVGFPQPVPPPGSTGRPPLPPHHQHHHHHHHHHRGYQTVTGYAVVEGRPVHERRLPCCGMGIGWLLFIIGFFLGGIPWYVGTFILLCVRVDYREKPGYVACTIASILAVIAVTLGATKGARTCWKYQVVGRKLPTASDEHPKIYRMKLWATNEVRAKSKFWYFLRKLKKVKKSNGQVLAINEIFEKNPTTIKNYGIWLRYQSRTGYHNMYKEYRDTTLNGAVEQMYIEMASRHRVRFPCIQIIKTATIPAKLCKRESTKQFHNSKIKFPLVFRKVRPPSRKLKTTYKASRPNLFV